MNKLIVVLASIGMALLAMGGLVLSVGIILETPEDWGMVILVMFGVVVNLFVALSLIPFDQMKRSSGFRNVDYTKININSNIKFADYDKFEGIYSELVKKYKAELDKVRRPIMIKRLTVILSIVFTLGGAFIGMMTLSVFASIVSLVAALVFCVSLLFKTAPVTEYKRRFFETAFTGMINAMDDTKMNDADIVERYEVACESYDMGYNSVVLANKFQTADIIGNKILDVKFVEGVLANLRVGKGIDAEIFITSNVEDAGVMMHDGYNKLEMDSPEFESLFNLYSDNQMLAMRLFTSDILDLIARAKIFLGINMKIRIRGNNINITMPMYDVINVSALSNNMNKGVLLENYEILLVIREIMIALSKQMEELQA